MDRLASMATFVKAAELGSFTAAATALDISGQMVAKHITYLETRLGTRLINRTTRRQSLTEIGKSYYERCKQVLADVDWADALVDEARGVPSGRLRVNAPVSLGSSRLMSMVTRYLRQYPDVHIDLVLSDRFVDLIDDGFEAVFRTGPLQDSGLTARELAPFRMLACASPAYLRERGAPRTPDELDAHECLGFTHWSRPTVYEWCFTRAGQSYPVTIRNHLQVNDAKALLAAALNGFGIILIAEDLVREALDAGTLVQVLPDYAPPSRQMHLIFHADRQQTPKLRSFIDAVMAEFGPKHSTDPSIPV